MRCCLAAMGLQHWTLADCVQEGHQRQVTADWKGQGLAEGPQWHAALLPHGALAPAMHFSLNSEGEMPMIALSWNQLSVHCIHRTAHMRQRDMAHNAAEIAVRPESVRLGDYLRALNAGDFYSGESALSLWSQL